MAVKRALLKNLAPLASAVLVDPQYLFPSSLDLVPHDKGLIITLEFDRFEETPRGRLSRIIPNWSVSKIKLGGGDAVKLLAWYRPDADVDVIEHQQDLVEKVAQQCHTYDLPFVFELLVYPFPSEDIHTSDYIENPSKKAEHVIESVETFAQPRFGVDLFKLESPVPASSIQGDSDPKSLADSFAALNAAAGRPWVVLSAGADQSTFLEIARLSFEAGASGYLAGRAIWWETCVACFPDLETLELELRDTATGYMSRLNNLTDELARPWVQHPRWDPNPVLPRAGEDFRRSYGLSG